MNAWELGKWERFDGLWGVYKDGRNVVVCSCRDSAENICAFHSETGQPGHIWEVKRIKDAR